MSDLPEFLKALFQNAHLVEVGMEDKAQWPQVALFKPEDRLKHKQFSKAMDVARNQCETLESKAKLIASKANHQRTEFWNFIYKKYSLSPGRSYTITEDGRILMRPEK